jgi:hypothetical protein
MRAYLTNTHMCLENGTRIRLYHINNFASPVVTLDDGTELELKWEFYLGCGRVLYVDVTCSKKWSNINWISCRHCKPIGLQITKISGHVIISELLRPNVIFCQPITDTLPIFHDGMLVWLGHTRELVLALIQAEKSASYPVTSMLEYCTINCNVYVNSPDNVRFKQIGEQAIAINKNFDVYILQQIEHIPDINKCVLHRLKNGRIVFSSGFYNQVYYTTECFNTVEQVCDNALILNGITYYFRNTSLVSICGKTVTVRRGFPGSYCEWRVCCVLG